MPDKLNKILRNNLGLKASALLLAVFVWAVISGREKTYSERTLKVPIEVVHISSNLEVVNLQPEEARVSLKGSANVLAKIQPEQLAIKIDLENVRESSKLNFFTEDFLEVPRNVQVISIHPKMIEVFVEEFASKELPVRIRFRGQLREPLKLKEARVVPDRVTIIGYKSQLGNIGVVFTEEVDLGEIETSQKRTIPLKQTRTILKFRDRRVVDLMLEIESVPAKAK